jgi:hypothetical protein
MKFFDKMWALLARSPMDGALVAVVVLGSFGVNNGAVLLQPEREQAPKALAIIPQSPAPVPPARVFPSTGYSFASGGTGRASSDNPPPSLAGQGLPPTTGQGVAGGQVSGVAPGNPDRGLVVIAPKISLGNGGTGPQGGFAPTISAGSSQSAPSVPEPSTWMLIGLGSAMIAAMAYRDRKKLAAATQG